MTDMDDLPEDVTTVSCAFEKVMNEAEVERRKIVAWLRATAREEHRHDSGRAYAISYVAYAIEQGDHLKP